MDTVTKLTFLNTCKCERSIPISSRITDRDTGRDYQAITCKRCGETYIAYDNSLGVPFSYTLRTACRVQQQVLEFHRHGSHLINPTPTPIDLKTKKLRQRLIQEEANELYLAMAVNDLTLVADALADLLYVVYGTAISYGLDMEPICDEVHRSNMTKFGRPGEYRDTCDASGKSLKDAGGKTLKPSTYESPDLAPIIEAQRNRTL